MSQYISNGKNCNCPVLGHNRYLYNQAYGYESEGPEVVIPAIQPKPAIYHR